MVIILLILFLMNNFFELCDWHWRMKFKPPFPPPCITFTPLKRKLYTRRKGFVKKELWQFFTSFIIKTLLSPIDDYFSNLLLLDTKQGRGIIRVRNLPEFSDISKENPRFVRASSARHETKRGDIIKREQNNHHI